MELLKLKLWNEDNIAYMQVLEQGENVRGTGHLVEFQGLELHSIEYPDLGTNTVFVRGTSSEKDNNISSLEFNNESQAKEYIRKVEALVDIFNAEIDKDLEPSLEVFARAEDGDKNFNKLMNLEKDLIGANLVKVERSGGYNFGEISLTLLLKNGNKIQVNLLGYKS